MRSYYKYRIITLICCIMMVSIVNTVKVQATSIDLTKSNNLIKDDTLQATSPTSDFVWPEGPTVTADGAIVMEASTGLVLYEKNSKEKFYPASITKIMTTLLALENCNLNETVTMSHEAEWDVDFDSSRIGLVEGEELTLSDALYGVMLESANEVSYAVGEHVVDGKIEDFSSLMNARAKELGCSNTNFVNPHGLHDDNHYTCAYDMALIGRAAIALPEFQKLSGSRTHTIPATNKNVARPLANHHRFIRKTLTYADAIGGKTGGTEEAKTTLVTFAKRNGLTLIAVVLHVNNALDAYADTIKMFDFAFDHYTLYNIEQTELSGVGRIPDLISALPIKDKEQISLIRLGENSNVVLPISANFADATRSVSLQPVEEFVHGDNVIGKISYTYEGKYVGFADIIYYNKAYPLTKEEFDNRWPDYMIPPDQVLSSTEIIKSVDTILQNSSENKQISQEKEVLPEKIYAAPWFYGICVAVVILIIGWYVIYIEIPHRRKRKAYRKNHRIRMSSLSNLSNDDFPK